MKKIFILIAMLSLVNAETNIDTVKDIKTEKEVNLSKEYLDSVKTVLGSEWDKIVTKEGKATLRFFLNTREGKLEKIIVVSKTQDKDFKNEVKTFIKSLDNKVFNRTKTKNNVIDIVITFSKVGESMKENYISLYKSKKETMYEEYVNYLVKQKGYSKEQIKKILHGEKKTISQTMLKAIYLDYTMNNEDAASELYYTVIKANLDRFKNNTEGLYLVDFLLRKGHDKAILDILPKFSCQYMEEPKRDECFYYRARALYNLGDEDYEIPLNIAKNKLTQAKMFYNNVNSKGIVSNKKTK